MINLRTGHVAGISIIKKGKTKAEKIEENQFFFAKKKCTFIIAKRLHIIKLTVNIFFLTECG